MTKYTYLLITAILTPFFVLLIIFFGPKLPTSSEAPTSAEAALEPEPSGTVGVTQTITLQPSFSSEDGENASRIELCNTLASGRMVPLLVKGDPPIPGGGYLTIGMDLGPGIKLVFRKPPDEAETYSGTGWSKSYWIPAEQEQHVLMIMGNTGDDGATACFRLSYEHPPEPEPDPENKGMNDPPIPMHKPTADTPRTL